MSWTKRILIGYAIALLLLIHLSLFFCEDANCGIQFDKNFLPQELADRIHVFLSKLPLRLNTIQNWAQWIVIGEVMLITIELIRLMRRIFCCIVWIVLIAACFSGLLIYLTNMNMTNEIWNQLVENGNGIIGEWQLTNNIKQAFNAFSFNQ